MYVCMYGIYVCANLNRRGMPYLSADGKIDFGFLQNQLSFRKTCILGIGSCMKCEGMYAYTHTNVCVPTNQASAHQAYVSAVLHDVPHGFLHASHVTVELQLIGLQPVRHAYINDMYVQHNIARKYQNIVCFIV